LFHQQLVEATVYDRLAYPAAVDVGGYTVPSDTGWLSMAALPMKTWGGTCCAWAGSEPPQSSDTAMTAPAIAPSIVGGTKRGRYPWGKRLLSGLLKHALTVHFDSKSSLRRV